MRKPPGRPPGPPSSIKDVSLYNTQWEHLEALQAIAPIPPSRCAQVRQAVQEYIVREMAKPGVREQVEAHFKQSPNVVKLRDVKNDK